MTNPKLKQVTIENLGPFEKQVLKINAVNIFTGANATGKTSILDSIMAAFRKGDNKSLIRSGCDSGSVELSFESGPISRAKKTFHRNKMAVLKLWDKNNLGIPSPVTVMDSLHCAQSINIGDFLDKKKGEQGEIILRACPLAVTKEELLNLLKSEKMTEEIKEAAIGIVPYWGDHALTVIEQVYNYIFSARTAENAETKRQKGHLETLMLSDATQFDSSINWRERTDIIFDEITGLEKKKFDGLEKIKLSHQAASDELYSEYQDEIEDIKADYVGNDNRMIAARDKSSKELEQATQIQHEKLIIAREEAKANAQFEEQVRMNVENIDETETAIAISETASGGMSTALQKLKGYKQSLTEKLPIKGLSLENDMLYLDGLPWERVNTSRKLELSLEITALRMKENGSRIAFVDGFERLDSKATSDFLKYALEKNIIIIGGRVADGELKQESEIDLITSGGSND